VPAADLFSVEGKVAVVTGGSRGIGEMIATALVEAGATVVIASRKADELEATAGRLRQLGDCVAVPADLSTYEGAHGLAAAVAEQHEAVHVLVNNAGATWGEDIASYPEDGFDKVLDVNVKGVFALTQALLPQLRAAGTAIEPASVVNVGSIDGIRVPAFESYAYSASKAAVHQLTRHLASRLAREHVRVNAIAPGLFPSRMTAFMLDQAEEQIVEATPLRRIGGPDDMAGAVLFLASRASSFVTGAVLPVDGGVATCR
jgi:NAD(P)-dependent dehydrogenase (short-subunit alcohol dehydrogenase family)